MDQTEDTPVLISCKDAKANGSTTYYTGIPCKYGHIQRRYVVNHSCVKCSHIASRAARAKINPNPLPTGRPRAPGNTKSDEEMAANAATARRWRAKQKLLPDYDVRRKAYNEKLRLYLQARRNAKKEEQNGSPS